MNKITSNVMHQPSVPPNSNFHAIGTQIDKTLGERKKFKTFKSRTGVLLIRRVNMHDHPRA